MSNAVIMFKDGFFTSILWFATVDEAIAACTGYQYGIGRSNDNHSAAFALPTQLEAAQAWRDNNQDLPQARPQDEYEKAIAECAANGVVVG
jgi:hypothetical protein